MSEKSDLENKIKYAKGYMDEYNKKKEKYERLKKKIQNDVIPKVNQGKINISKGNSSLKANMESNISDQSKEELEDYIESLENIKKELKNQVLPEIERKITSLEKKIKYQKGKISDYRDKIKNLDKE